MNRYFFASGIVLLLFVMVFGCSDDPNDTGLGLVSPQDTLRIESSITRATSDTTFLSRVTGAQAMIVGKYQDLEARALMQFIGFTSIPASARIDSAVLSFTTDYRFKDSSGTLGFSIHEMTRSWSEVSFLWDSSETPGIYNSTPDTTFLKNITSGDSLVTIRIDKLVRQWVQSSTDAPNGIILIPDLISTNIILGPRNYLDVETRPLLTVTYRDSADSVFTFSTRSLQRCFVANSSIPGPSNVMFVQGGVAYHGLVRFDSLAIPKRVSVTQATLELQPDNSSSLLNASSYDTLVIFLSRKNSYPFDSLVLGTICVPDPLVTPKIYRTDIRSIVQQWLTREPNYGIVIRPHPSSEFRTLDRFALYNATAPVALRPKLTIKYTVLP